jgi:ABC-2 type transport system ATP-binding protein
MTDDTDTGRTVATMPGPPSASVKPAVEVVDLRRRYGSFEAVRGISFTVQPGEVLALLWVTHVGWPTSRSARHA